MEVFGPICPLSTGLKTLSPVRLSPISPGLGHGGQQRCARGYTLQTEANCRASERTDRQIEQTAKQLYTYFIEFDIAFRIAIEHAAAHLVTIGNANVITPVEEILDRDTQRTRTQDKPSEVVKGSRTNKPFMGLEGLNLWLRSDV